MKRVIVIGFDGADWNLLNSYIDQGKLPNFEKITKNGVHGPLKSTMIHSDIYDIAPIVLDIFNISLNNLDSKSIREITEV